MEIINMIAALSGLPDGSFSAGIRDLQIALHNAGHNPGALDGVLGRRTRAAIEAWRARAWDASANVIEYADEAASQLIRETAVKIMRGFLDVREVGGNNRGPKVEAFLRYWNHELPTAAEPKRGAWCAAFVGFCHDIAARMFGFRLADYSGNVDSLREKTPYFSPGSEVPAGSYVYRLSAAHSDDREHVEALTRDSGGTHDSTIGGNTSASRGADRDGSGVFEHQEFLRVDDPRHGGYGVPRYRRLVS